MGNKLSCSCAPLIKKTGYRYEDSPWNPARRRDGHLLRLWAEVFHVSSSGAGTVKWQQVSEDLVPVNITCIQDTPECVFHITAYNSQVDKILDVRLIQPGTRIGQASECFVYWKDPATNDTWGLNFTSPIDAKQFRECCSPSFKFSRKASSSYSLKLEPVRAGGGKNKGRRKPVSTPASPSRSREPQCTCMTAEQYARLRAQDPRFREENWADEKCIRCKCKQGIDELTENEMSENDIKENGFFGHNGHVRAASDSPPEVYDNLQFERSSSTLPRTQQGGRGVVEGPNARTANHGAPHTTATTTTTTTQAGTCDTMASRRGGADNYGTIKVSGNREGRQPPSHHASHTSLVHKASNVGSLARKDEGSAGVANDRASESATAGSRDNRSLRGSRRELSSKSVDYSEMDTVRETDTLRRRARSKSTDDVTKGDRDDDNLTLDSNTLKKMLKPMSSTESPATSPESGRRRANRGLGGQGAPMRATLTRGGSTVSYAEGFSSEPDAPRPHRLTPSRSAMSVLGGDEGSGGRRGRGFRLDLGERESPPSDHQLFDLGCYATTPSSSIHHSACFTTADFPRYFEKRNSDFENNAATPSSPTSQLLQEYEMHLRNTLAKGMDAESYSLHTFEALLTQSMENLGSLNKHGMLPTSARGSERSLPTATLRDERDHSGYFSDRNDSYGSRRDLYDRGYMSDHERRFYDRQDSIRSGYMSDRERGYTSDRDSRGYMSDRERGYMSDRERGYMSDRERGYMSDRERGYMSDRERGYTSDRERGYTSDRERGYTSDRERGYTSDRERGYTSDRERGYMSDRERGYMSDRERGYMSDRERGYMSDRDSRGYASDRERGYASDRGGYGSDRERGYSSDREHNALVAQASMESADSRLCYLTSSEMSDDDRMSLTTAVSEDEEGESVHNSPYKAPRAGTTAASFNCTGAVRKAGFLSVKKWLLRKKHQIELARKRGWKGYWVCLKGTTLLFYPCDSREGRSVEAAPKHLIIVDGAIMQPIPEHPKRDYIFCLSTAFGDAYLFQAPCQVELENWVNSIHSACAAAFARHRGKTGTLHLLQEEIFRIDRAIESDSKLKHMAELQLSVVSDAESKQQIMGQIKQWEENLERLHCEQFRLRCYMASLQAGELPNPKGLLTHVSRTTKTTLNRLGVFTVSSFHAYICARSPSLLNNLLAGRGATKRRAPMLSRSNSVSSRRSLQMQQQLEGEKQYKVNLPDNQTVTISIKDSMTVEEFLVAASGRKNLNPMEHFVRVKKRRELEETNYFVPHRTDLIENYLATHEVVEICAKILYQVELSRSSLDHMWGFSVEAELIENSERQDELCCYISRVEDRSTAMQNEEIYGIIKGDEIMVINGAIVSDLDMMYIESVLQEELALCLMMRSSRTDPPDLASLMKTTDEIIESLVCPPPPTETSLNEEMISRMIVPAPTWNKPILPGKEPASPDGFPPPASDTSERSNVSSLEIENFLRNSELSGCCRSPVERRSSPTGSIASTQSQSQLTPSRQLSDGERLKKVILELIDTERSYVKHLNNLLENYLEPLKSASFLSSAEVNALFGNIREIVAFQRLFLQALQEALDMEPGFSKFDQPYEFKNVLFSIGSAFLYYASQFKLYSSFCASHSKAQKVLHPSEGNQALQEFLASRNPRQQHSATLESYLIKPIQRILKYPLLLQQLKALTTPGSDEHRHLVEALKVMEKVAEHINEMQRIHEEYGAIFDHLFRQHQKSCKQDPRISRDPHLPQPIDLSPGDLLYYGGVEWLNISDFLGKIKKGLELHAMCFVFKTAVVFLCKERLRQKKKLMVSAVGVPGKNSSSEVEIIRYQVLIPVTEVQVRASSMKDMDSHFLWELIHLKSQLQRRSEKVYHLSNSTSEFRNAFLKTIRQIIRESVRNMNIPANKPSSSSSNISNKGNTNTLQPSRSAPKKKAPTVQSATLQRHSAGNIDYDNLESYDNVPETQIGHDQSNFQTRSKTVSDGMDELSDSTTKSDGGKDEVGTRSEGEEEVIEKKKATLGRTPNHLSLSTTSTLSTGSTGSMAKLIQASNQPSQYQPAKSVGSPVWKPRDAFAPGAGSTFGAGAGGAGQRGESLTLPRAGKPSGREDHFLVYEEYGGNIYMSSKKDTDDEVKDTANRSGCPSIPVIPGVPIPTNGSALGSSPAYMCGGVTTHHLRPSHLSTHYTDQHSQGAIHRPPHDALRPVSVNGSSFHAPSPDGGTSGNIGSGGRRGAHGDSSKSSPWPGFPYTGGGETHPGEDMESVLGNGTITIDALLQQLRALS
ncbi:protein still life, isoform SIF type 1-like isoform X12 [Penaeus japonicus]|uniref:protein still life, isoform SIF type 1-like isoform X12 n=1 Tax=Penaeus japonicus TaxID=27405 RepID=UPI001C711C6E|nr:protein still life, isoform SIF type 1-like isoform X12 [Penaeus japonicus]